MKKEENNKKDRVIYLNSVIFTYFIHEKKVEKS